MITTRPRPEGGRKSISGSVLPPAMAWATHARAFDMIELRHPAMYRPGGPPLWLTFLCTHLRTTGVNLARHCAIACSRVDASAPPIESHADKNIEMEKKQ